MDCEKTVYYKMGLNDERLGTNFDDLIPQLIIRNSCKGHLIDPKTKAEYLKDDIDGVILSEFTPKKRKQARKVVKDEQDDSALVEEKSYKCNFCDYESTSKYKIRMHRKKHAGEDYACHLCTFKTLNKNDLQQHVKGHVNEKVYKCAYCNFQTLYKTGLKTHLLRHTGNKPFKCSQCDYRAFQKIHVERHSVTHATEKSKFKCPLCTFKTAFKIRLERHVLAHEKQSEVKSEECEATSDETVVDNVVEELSEKLLLERQLAVDQIPEHQVSIQEPPEVLLQQFPVVSLPVPALVKFLVPPVPVLQPVPVEHIVVHPVVERPQYIEQQPQNDQTGYLQLNEDNGPQQNATEVRKCDLCDYVGTDNLLLLHIMETHEGENV